MYTKIERFICSSFEPEALYKRMLRYRSYVTKHRPQGVQDMLTTIFYTIFSWHEINKASHVYRT